MSGFLYLEVVSRVRVNQTSSRRLVNIVLSYYFECYFGHFSCRVSSKLGQNLPTICIFVLLLDLFSTILRT